MPVVIDATPGGGNSNSYCTLAEANAYHETRLFAASWEEASADTRNRALVSATRLLDSHISWLGDPSAAGIQALQWPRSGMYDAFDKAIDEGEIPQVLKDATAEFARLLIESDRTAEVSSEGIGEIGLGPIQINFSDEGQTRKVIPSIIQEMLSPWIDKAQLQKTCAVKLVRS